MIIDESENGIHIEGEPCPTCNSEFTVYDRQHGFWMCEECSTVWGHDKDDPDYDELELCPECSSSDTAHIAGINRHRCGNCGFEFRPSWLVELQEG